MITIFLINVPDFERTDNYLLQYTIVTYRFTYNQQYLKHMNSAEIKLIKQKCKRMIKENFTEAFDWLGQTIGTEDFINTLEEYNCEESGAFELYVTTESAGVPVTGVTFYILATIGLLFGIGVEINGVVKRVEYTNFFDSVDELAHRLCDDSYREEIVKTIFKQIDMVDDKAFQNNP
jgi:hypothetical protein